MKNSVLVILGLCILGFIVFLLLKDKVSSVSTNDNKSSHNNNLAVDYNIYIMTLKEKVFYILIAAVVVFILGYIFYHNLFLSIMLIPIAFLYPKKRTKEIIKSRKDKLNVQFKEALYSLASSMAAGKAIETAFKDALKDLSIMYPDSDTYIIKELKLIIMKLEMNETVELAIQNFAKRSHIEDIQNFADVFVTCKRTGANLIRVMKNTCGVINDKITVKQEIDTMLWQRKFEQKILNSIPVLMILFLSVSAKDFMEPVFNSALGKISMTFTVILLTVAYYISKKIIDIEV